MSASDRAMKFAAEMRDAGTPAVVIYTDDDGAVRMATVELPQETMAQMLRLAGEAYAARCRSALN